MSAQSEPGERAIESPEDAVVLVGGEGTRLRPLTYAVPKPLVPVLNKPLVAHLLENLRRHGVRRVVLAASANQRDIEKALGDGAAFDLTLSYAYEDTPLGSGLAVKQAAQDIFGPFFVCNGDVITDLDLGAMAAQHRAAGAILSIALAAVDDPTGYGVAELQVDNRITRFVEKPIRAEAPSSWANAGTWIFERDVLDYIPDERLDRSLEQLVFPSLIAEGLRVQGFPSDAYWMDVGTPERYVQLHADILSGRLRTAQLDGIDARASIGPESRVAEGASLSARVLVGRGCEVGARVVVSGPSVLGDDCSLAESATFEASIAWAGVTVGRGARVRHSILGAGCRVGADAVVEEAIRANGAVVRDGFRLPRGARLEPGEVAG